MIDHFFDPLIVVALLRFAVREGPNVDVKPSVAWEIQSASARWPRSRRGLEEIGVAIEVKGVEIGYVIQQRVSLAPDGLWIDLPKILPECERNSAQKFMDVRARFFFEEIPIGMFAPGKEAGLSSDRFPRGSLCR